MGLVRVGDLLSHSADRRDRPVELHLSGGGDAVPVGHVAPELLHHLERECEAGRRTTDVAGVDRDPNRELEGRRLLGRESDQRLTIPDGDRPNAHCERLAAPPDA